MNTLDEFMTPAQRRQTSENFKLARRFLDDYLRDPGSFSGYTDGNPIVLLPPANAGEDDLRDANLQMAQQMMSQGRTVIVHEVAPRVDDRLLGPEVAPPERKRSA
ncbi:MAG: hypothetical protein QM692_23005 [Thermomicrobiales bacterium]